MKSFKDTRAERRASSENTNTSTRMSFKETKAKRTGVPYTPKTSIKPETKTATAPAATQRAKSTLSPSQDGYRRRQTNVPAEQSFFYKIGDIFDEKIKQAEKAKKQRDAQDEIVRDVFVSSAFKPYDEASADPFAAYKVKQAGRTYGDYINATHSAGELLREADDILFRTDYRGVYDSAEEDARSKRNAAYGKMSIEELEELKNKRDGFVSESGRNVSDFVNDVIDYAAVPSSAADAKEEKRNYIISSAGMYGTDADTVKRVLDRVDQGVDPYEAENIIASALGGNSDSENNVIDAFIRQKRAAAKDDEWEEADRKYAARAKAAWNNSGKAAKISLPGTGKLGGEWEEPEIEKKNSGYSDYIINSLSKKTLEKIKGNHAPEIRSVDDAVAQAYFKLTEPDYIFISLGNSISTERFANLDELNDRELATLVTIYNEDGADAADEYLSHMKYATDKRITERMYGNMEEFAGDHPFAASVLSVPMNTLGGVTGLSAQISALFGADVSQYDMSLLLSNASNKAREVVSEDMSGVGSFFYQTGMSMADCIFNMAVAYALTPGAGSNITEGMSPFEKIKAGVRDAGTTMNLIMSSSAASSTFSEKLSEGYTTSEAALLAGLSGFAEYITEKVSIETYLKSKGWLQSILSSMAAEGSEEFNSDVINSVGAKLLVGESEIEKQTAELMASGMSEKEAFNKAFTDWWAQAGLDALGGAISGLGFSFLSGGRIALEKADAVRNARKYTVPAAKDIIAQGGRAIDYAVDEGLKYGPDTSAGRYAALLAAQSEESGKYASRRQITRLLTKEITDASPRVEIDTQVRKNYDGSAPVFSRNDNGGALVRLGDRYVGKDEISFANLDPAVREVYAEAVTMTDENGRFDAERANKYAQLYDGSDPAEYRRVFNAAEEAGENGVTFAATEDLIGETDVSPRAALEAWAYGQKINSEANTSEESGVRSEELSTGIKFKPMDQYSADQQKEIGGFLGYTNPEIVSRAADLRNNKNLAEKRLKISDVSSREADDLYSLLGKDFSGYTNNIGNTGFNHIEERHGVNGEHDNSMSDLNDLARVGWVLDNYDSVDVVEEDDGVRVTYAYQNRDNTPAPLLKFSKKIDGTYYAVVASPESKYKKLWVLSAYTEKNKSSTVTQAVDAVAPSGTSETFLASPNATNDSIAQFGEDVNPRPDEVSGNVDSVNETVNVNNEKTPGAERASRATFDDFEHRRVIKRQNGSVTDQSGTLTKDDLFVIGAVADKFGLDINILNKMDDGSWGEFVRIMHQINLSSKSDLFSSFMHELGHVIEFWAPEKFAGIKYGFRDFIIQKYGMRTMSDLLDDVKARYGNISDDAALVELACDQLEVVRDVESFAEEVAENLSKAGYTQSKIRQFLRDIADFLKRAADVIRSWAKGKDGKGGAKTAAGVYAERDAAYCKQLAEKFLDAADTAAENYKAHANGESAGAEADGKVKKMYAPKSDDYVDLSFEKELADKIGNIHGAEKYKIIANYILEKTNGTVTFSDGFSAIIDKRDSLHIANKAADKKTAEISAVNDLIKKAQYYAYADRVEHNKFDYFKYYWANVKYGKDVFPVFFNLGRGKYDRTYHLYDITHKISDTAHRVNDVGRPRRFRPANGITTDSIPQNGDLSTPDLETHKMMPPSAAENDAKYLSAVKSGDMETAQAMVEEAAKAAGYSRRMYHGAKRGKTFTVFKGWQYFTENEKYARRYTGNDENNMYSVFVKAEHPFDTRTAEARKVFENIRQEYGLSDLSNLDSGLPDWTDGYDISDYIEENDLPYDMILLDEGGDLVDGKPVSRGISYVVRDSAQIKSADPITYDDNGNIIPLSERFNGGNSDIRYMRPQEQSEVDELRSQLETERAERTDYEKKTNEQIEALEKKNASTEKSFEEYRARDERDKLRKRIQRTMNWFKKRAVNPSSTAFVPAPLYDSLIDVCQALDFSHNIDPDSDAGKKVAVLKQKYDLLAQYKKNPHEYARIYGVSADKIYDLSNAFDEEISEELEMLSRLLNGGVDDEGNFTAPIAVMDMNNEQLSEAAELLERMKNTFDDYAYVIGEEVRITYASMRDKFYWQQKQFMNSPLRMRGFFENLTSPMRAIAELEGHNPDGVMTKLFKALEQGEFKQMKTYMEIMKPFDELMADKKAFKKYSTKLVDSGLVDDKNKPIMLTHDDIVTIIMTYERERQSGFFTKHLQESGITVYDRDFVKKGNIEKAAEKSQRMRHVTSFDVLKLTDLLTDYDRKWMAAAENFFNKQSAKILDEVVFMLKHKHMIPTKYYIPFIVDKNYLVGDIEALKFDSRMSKAGYLEEVQHGANNPLIITGLSEVVKRHAESVSNQAGYAVPLYNLNRFYESPVRDDSVKFIVEKAFGKRGHGKGTSNIIEQVSADVQKPRIKSDKMRSDAMLGNYVVNVLTANLGVTIKQAASYEAAGIYLSQRALGKLLPEALGRVGRFADTVWHFDKICKEIDKYTGLHYMRRIGLSTPEISMMKKTGWRNKLPGMKWIQYVDCVTTAALWEATKKQVSYDYKKEKKSYSSLYRKYDGITVTNSEYDAMQKPVTLNGGITVIVPNYSEAEIRANCARMQEMKSVADLPVSVLDKTGMKPSELIASYFESIGNAIETKRFGTVKAGRSSVKSEVRHGRTAEKLGTLSAIPDVLEKGTVIFQNKKTEGGADRLVVSAPVTIGEKEYYMGVMLQRDANTQTLYAHNVILKEKSNGASHAILVTDKDAGESATLHITSILQNAANVNSENEYWKRVTELYERVIVDTQPMYDVLHRPEFSKKDNPAHKALHMFRTVPFQNLGILADSVSEFGAATKEAYNAYKNKQSESQKQESKEKLKNATHKLQRVARVTITGIVAFELFTIFSNLVKRKDKKYRDEYGDLTWDSFKEGAIWELASNLAATLFPYSPVNPVDTVKSFTENGPSWDFVSGLPAGEVINDALNGINNVRKAIDEVPEILDDETVDTWGLINKLFGKDSAVFGLAKTLGQATGVPVGNYADIGASIYGWANDIYKGKNPFEGEYTKSQIINKLYDMRMDGDTAGAGKAYEEAIHIKNKNGEELGKKGVESEMVKRLADDPTLAELADAYMDYDFTTYDLLFAELSEKGFTDNEISKAREKYRKELLEEETEDDPDEDPEQYKEFPYKDVAQAIKDGKSEYIDRALEYYRAEGVTDDALKSGITRWMKPIYADADENDRKKYQDILNNRFGFNKDKYGKKKEFDFSKWETSYTYNDLYSAVTGGAGDQAHEIFESLAMLKGPGEEGRKKAREELADKLREVYVKMNGTERADMHDFLKKYCGFPSNYNFGAWLNRNYK